MTIYYLLFFFFLVKDNILSSLQVILCWSSNTFFLKSDTTFTFSIALFFWDIWFINNFTEQAEMVTCYKFWLHRPCWINYRSFYSWNLCKLMIKILCHKKYILIMILCMITSICIRLFHHSCMNSFVIWVTNWNTNENCLIFFFSFFLFQLQKVGDEQKTRISKTERLLKVAEVC